MVSIVIADKSRLTVRGVMDGARYLVRSEANGWWIEPVPEVRRRVREVKDATKDLSAHLDALAGCGFEFEPLSKENTPPCRF
jgi:hypothetical protein